MLEMKLMTKTDEYQKAWLALTPQLWEFVTNASQTDGLEEIDEGKKLFQLINCTYKYLKCLGYRYIFPWWQRFFSYFENY